MPWLSLRHFCFPHAFSRSLHRLMPRRWHSSRQGGNVNDVALFLVIPVLFLLPVCRGLPPQKVSANAVPAL
jgi:hypothetical protein